VLLEKAKFIKILVFAEEFKVFLCVVNDILYDGEDKFMGILKKSGKVFFWNTLGSIIGFGFQMILAVLLGQQEYGKANILIGAVGTLHAFSGFGFSLMVIRECARLPDKALLILQSAVKKLLLVNCLLIPLLYFAIWIMLKDSNMNSWYYVFFCLAILISQTISELLFSFYRGISKPEKASFLQMVVFRSLYVLFFFSVVLLFGFTHYSMILGMALSWFVILVITVAKALGGYNKKENIKLPLRSNLYFYLTAITYSVYTSFSKVLQGIFATEATVGALSLGLTLGMIGNLFGAAFSSVAMPGFSINWRDRNFALLKETFMNVSRWNAFLVLPIVLFLTVNITRLMNFIGWKSNDLSWIVLILVLSQFFNSFVGPNGTLLNMAGKESKEMLNGFLKLCIGLLLGLTIGPSFTWGIAISIALSEIVVNISKLIQVRKYYGIYPYNIKQLVFLSIMALGEFSTFYVVSKAFSNGLLWIFTSSFFIIGFMAFSFIVSPDSYDRKSIRRFVETLKKKH